MQSTTENPVQQQPKHYMNLWDLNCGHSVTCGCAHAVGDTAWCWICLRDSLITGKERKPLYHSENV